MRLMRPQSRRGSHCLLLQLLQMQIALQTQRLLQHLHPAHKAIPLITMSLEYVVMSRGLACLRVTQVRSVGTIASLNRIGMDGSLDVLQYDQKKAHVYISCQA